MSFAERTPKNKQAKVSKQEEPKTEAELANEQALKDAAKEEPAKEEPKDEPEVIPEGACEVYGMVDLNSKACKNCPALEQCKVKSKAVAAAKGTASKGSASPRPRAVRVAGTGEFTKFGHCKINSQAGQIEAALETPRTVDEIAAMTGCTTSRIKSHINWLVSNHKAHCTKVTGEGGKVHFEVVEAAAV